MTTIMRTAFVPYSSFLMYDLVNNIEQYPLFLPWCPKASIIYRTENELQATLHFSKGVISKSFTTVNRLFPYQRIEMKLVQGPFRFLEGVWEFQNSLDGKGSQITLNISFEFNNALLSLTLGPLFNHIASTLVESFAKRAHQMYAHLIEPCSTGLTSSPLNHE